MVHICTNVPQRVNDGDAQACTYIRNPFTAKPDDLPVGTGE